MLPDMPTRLSDSSLAVHTTQLTKEFGKHTALDRVEFMVPENSFYVLIGPNGAGKTTFLKLLLELLVPTTGGIEVLGMDPTREGARVRAHIGYVPEKSDDLYTWMSVRRMIDFHRSYFPAWDEQYAQELTKKLGLKQGKISRLSKGEVRRAQLVMALAHRPPLLLLDEPTDGLDPVARDVFRGILAEHIATSPTTVIVSTHLVFEIEALADHLAVLSDGKILAQLPTEELHRKYKRYTNHNNAWTRWGDEPAILAELKDVREVRPVTLQEAAVALLTEAAQ
jgi:ABC-2 type transport system ATP-binding protein